ncbi:beta-N-acetylhexosaminidase [Priestia megaterium]|uniref:beta-N-acetylhexosaminidase n=1 Tax=Priestia megaterium TaxID=1404 RepID=UPI00300ACDE3
MKTLKKKTFILCAIMAQLVFVVIMVPYKYINQHKVEKVTAEKIEQKAANKAKEPVKEAKKKEGFSSESHGNVEEKAEQILKTMSIEEKVGQMMVVGFQTKEADAHIKKMISSYHVGGVILYDRNMENPYQVATLTNDLQDLAQKTPHQIPLIMSIDQEGGTIVRMRNKVSHLPSQQELGKASNQQKVYQTANKNGKELSAMGINLNYAPVLDLSDTDTRSFGTDERKATTFGEQALKGLKDAGITGVLKHFPGNGRSNVDPHVETSSVEANRSELENKDIYPFKQIINDVDNEQFFVMVTHIKYPAYDKKNQASVSPIIIQDLLRGKLGYKGMVVTDDLEMGAVSKHFTYEDLGIKTVQAGADVLLVCHTLENQEKIYNGILKAVKSHKITEERIDESVKRILKYKLHQDIPLHVDPAKAEQQVGKQAS